MQVSKFTICPFQKIELFENGDLHWIVLDLEK